MTILVGVKCTDGVVIGADSMATSAMGASPLVQVPASEKLQLIGNKGILACTGAVGLGQRVKIVADDMWDKRQFSGGGMQAATTLAGHVMKDFASSAVQRVPQHGINFGALLGMVVEKEAYLVEFGTTDFQPEIKKDNLFYVSMGSGQLLADPFLAFVKRVLWKDAMPDVERAKIGVYWALSYTIALAAGGVGGALRLGVIKKVGVDWTASILDDTQEQAQYIEELESKICLEEPFKEAAASVPPTLKK